jgi:aminoglycoside phosphotransferase (APT) family kinase protein
MMITETMRMTAAITREQPPLSEVLARPGTRAVLLAGSKDPNAKVTVVLLDGYGAAFVVKVPTTSGAAEVVKEEARLLESVRGLRIGRLATTVPQPLGYLDASGLPALVTNALAGTPMTVRYHGWRHTARRRRVRADFAAAGGWLAELQTRTAGARARVTLLADAMDRIGSRFPDHPELPRLRHRLAGAADRLSRCATPRTVVHGDYWYGNLLVARERRALRVVGVVDWEACALSGEPLRDVARFAASYALYLDRHVRPGHRVPGHRGLRADSWGAGLVHAVQGRGWFGALVRRYLSAAAERLGISGQLWQEIMLGGIADVAATADHPEFARNHLDLLVRVTGPDGEVLR